MTTIEIAKFYTPKRVRDAMESNNKAQEKSKYTTEKETPKKSYKPKKADK